jgi:hypothetical protein
MVMTWDDDTYKAPDGRMFMIASEHVRGEPRRYWATLWTGERYESASRADKRWTADDSEDKRKVKRDIERFARECPPG